LVELHGSAELFSERRAKPLRKLNHGLRFGLLLIEHQHATRTRRAARLPARDERTEPEGERHDTDPHRGSDRHDGRTWTHLPRRCTAARAGSGNTYRDCRDCTATSLDRTDTSVGVRDRRFLPPARVTTPGSSW